MTSTPAPIYILRDDYLKLRLLLATASYSNGKGAQRKLREELDRAAILDSAADRTDLVTLDSTVTYVDVGTGEVEEYTLTLPERANIEQRRLSIFAPVGTALLGCRVGDVVDWSTPGGLRQLKILRVVPRPSQPADAALDMAQAGAGR